jgi:hypothetical protein
MKLEEAGVKEARNAIFVLVAGGLGERLGYKGIKVNDLLFSIWINAKSISVSLLLATL